MEHYIHKILVIDDEMGTPNSAERTAFLRAVGYYSSAGGKEPVGDYPYEFEFHSGQAEKRTNSIDAVKAAVGNGWPDQNGDRWALVLLDVRFGPDENFGFTLLKALREDPQFGRALPIVMLTSEDEWKRVRADELNANGFLPKHDAQKRPFWSRAELEQRVLKFGLIPDDRSEALLLATKTERLLGRSLPLLMILREARRFAVDRSGNRILYGETGTGKTELAGYIHCYTGRSGPYVPWFADPATKELMKTELFGWWRNAFNGAESSQAGKIEEAHGGTFFLDEITNLPSDIQMALLQLRKQDSRGWRVLSRVGKFPRSQTGQREALQSVIPQDGLLQDHRIPIDILLLTGTKEDLEDSQVREQHGFARDLHNALGTPLRCPTLNDRREDVGELFEAFIERSLNKPGTPIQTFEIESAVVELLKQRDWSQRGNVRDLERIAEYAAQQLGDFRVVRVHCLPPDVQEDVPRPGVLERNYLGTTKPPITQPESRSGPGAQTWAELEHLKLRASLLEQAAKSERKLDAATGIEGKYQPTRAVCRLTGKKVTPTEAKRMIKDILGAILDTPKYLTKVYGEEELRAARDWVKSSPLLMRLYRYAIGEISAIDI